MSHGEDVRPKVALAVPVAPPASPDGRPSELVWKNLSETAQTCTFEQWLLREVSTRNRRSASGADISRMANLACHRCHRPRATMLVPRNDRPRNHRGRGCLLAPSTTRTPPAGTLPLVLLNVRVIRQLIIGISHRVGASWPLEPTGGVW